MNQKLFIVYVNGEVDSNELATRAWANIPQVEHIIVNEIVGAKDAEIISHQTQVK